MISRASSMLAMALLAAALMAGCAAPGGPAAGGAAGETKDRMTASDETDASKRARVRLELAAGYFGRGQMTTALDQVKLAIAADPMLGEAFNLRGLIYASLGDDRLAEESFRRALQINPRDADAMQNFGWYLCQQKRYAEANEQYKQALAVPQYRDAPRTLLTQGICHARAGDLAEAERAMVRAYELDPANPSTAFFLSELLYKRGEYERARFYIRRVNSSADVANAQTLWLAVRIENRLGNRPGRDELGKQLRGRFADSREASAFDRGQFDE